MTNFNIGDAVRIVSMGRDITPSEWVGYEGTVVAAKPDASLGFGYCVGPERYWVSGAEMIATSSDSGAP